MAAVMPEYMRVRKYLYNLVYNCDGTDLRIPPEDELTRIFGVSRVTVRGAIRGLVEDNLLVSRRGLGTFINPDACRQTRPLPIIGLLYGNGRPSFFPSDSSRHLAVQQCGMKAEPLYIPDFNAPERLVEIVRNNIAAVIWDTPSESAKPYLQAIRASGKPLLIFSQCKWDEYDTIYDARAERGELLANHLAALWHFHMLYIHNSPAKNIADADAPETTSGSFARRMQKLSGMKFDGMISIGELEKRLSEQGIGKYTVLYSSSTLVRPVMEILDKARLRVPDDLSYLTAREPASYLFHGLKPAYMDCDSEQIAAIVEWLKRKVIDGDKEPFFRSPGSFICNGETLISNK